MNMKDGAAGIYIRDCKMWGSDQLDLIKPWMKCQGGERMTLTPATYIKQNQHLTKEDKRARNPGSGSFPERNKLN